MPAILLRKRMHIDHVIHSVLLGESISEVSWYEQEDILLFGPFPSPFTSPYTLVKDLSLDTPLMWGRAVYQDIGHCVILDEMNHPCAINCWESAMTTTRYYYTPFEVLGLLRGEPTIKHRELLVNLVVEKLGQMGEYCPRWKYDVRSLLLR